MRRTYFIFLLPYYCPVVPVPKPRSSNSTLPWADRFLILTSSPSPPASLFVMVRIVDNNEKYKHKCYMERPLHFYLMLTWSVPSSLNNEKYKHKYYMERPLHFYLMLTWSVPSSLNLQIDGAW